MKGRRWLDDCFNGDYEMHSIAWWPTLFAVLPATVSDIRCCIPNWLVFPFLLAGVIVSSYTLGWHGLGQSSFGILMAVVLMGLLYWLGGVGMGDVKLCAGIGARVGPNQLAVAPVVMGIAGGVMAVAWAAYGGFLKESLDGAGDRVFGMRKRGFRPHETLVLGQRKSQKAALRTSDCDRHTDSELVTQRVPLSGAD
jgi:prepilin peptidase CpaA